MIVADDLGYADLSCCGQTDFVTPHLDALAAQGTRLTQAYANAPLCTNTRVALMMGRYQYRYALGLTEPLRHQQRHDPAMGLPRDEPNLASLLMQAGYHTALVGKWHLGALPLHGPLKSGYQEFMGVMGGFSGYFTHLGDGATHDLYEGEEPLYTDGYVTDLLSERAVRVIHAASTQSKPLFLSLHYTAPHWPWSAPSNEAQARQQERVATGLADGGSPRIYAEMVQAMDHGIGRVLNALSEQGMADNTLVIFTSDNGGERYSKNWPFVGRKMDLLEGGLRIPLLLRWPGHVASGKISEQVCISMDLTATCLAAAGLHGALERLDGCDLLPLLAGEKTQERTLFWRMRNRDQAAMRHGAWKYLRVSGQEYLFDLRHDWRERANFASTHPDRLIEMRRRWLDWNATMMPVPNTPEGPRLFHLSDMLW